MWSNNKQLPEIKVQHLWTQAKAYYMSDKKSFDLIQ